MTGARTAAGQLDLVLRAHRVLTDDGERPLAVGVRDGVIAAIEPLTADLPARHTIEVPDEHALLPGLVDSHVHVNEPGRTQWEGFASATRAAAAGGVTTIIDMPLNCVPPTTSLAALRVKQQVAAGQTHVDVGFWGGVVPDNLDPEHPAELRALHEAGVFGFKCFLLPSGVEEFGHLSPQQLDQATAVIGGLGSLLVVHAEDAETIEGAPPAHGRRYADFLSSRPPGAEDVAVGRVLAAARSTGARVHVLHLSSAAALPMLAAARREGVRVTAETCPHYLGFAAEAVPDGATQYKCCPPIRDAANRERLWAGLAEGTIDCVVTDHSPCTPELKRLDVGDFGHAWGGVSSLQLGLSAVWTQARARGFTLAEVVRWMAAGPAAVAGLTGKGSIALGHDADLVVLAPDQARVVDPRRLRHRHPLTPYAELPLTGVVRSTWLRGVCVHAEDDEPLPAALAPTGRPTGQLLRRGQA